MAASALAPFAFVGGLLTGSFLTVVASRVPEGRSVVAPRSACPSCGKMIAAYDNIPVLSWLILRGRCRGCKTKISPLYPLLELSVAIAFAATALVLGGDDPAELALGLILVATLAVVTVTDIERLIIPNKILIFAAVAGVVLVAATDPSSFAERGIAAAAGSGFLFCALMAYPQGMGFGDVKLAGVMGFYLGASIAPAMLVALLAGSVVGVGMLIAEGASARKSKIPFGAFLALGGLVGLLAGPELIDWYQQNFLHR